MSLSRRQFLVGSVGVGALATLSFEGCDDGGSSAVPLHDIPIDKAAFAHGVASGDPAQDSVLLWTRVSSEADKVELTWVIARDAELTDIVSMENVETTAARDYTVKVIASGLEAGTTYYYAFFASDDARSVTGRTRTLPATLEHARIAFTSCANYGYGYFHAYRAIAARADLDLWIHLGDYIYEYAYEDYSDAAIDRKIDPLTECFTVEDYRRRYANWRTDLDLQEIHRQHPLVVVWDDHEVANNAWKDGAENHQADEGDYQARKKAGIQAFLEWLPIRVEQAATDTKIYRQFAFGELFDLIMLDTRQLARSEQPGTDQIRDDNTIDHGDASVWEDPTRTLLGKEQETWFKAALSTSQERGAKWRVIGNQVIFSRLRDFRDGAIFFCDFWDGYKPAQKAILDHIVNGGIDNVVFLTGDIHTSWALEICPDPFDSMLYNRQTGEGSIGVELVGPSVTSVALENLSQERRTEASLLLTVGNPHLKYYEVTRKGYVLVDFTPARMQAEWYFMKDIKTLSGFGEELAKAYACQSGTAHLVEVQDALPAKANPPALAPEA